MLNLGCAATILQCSEPGDGMRWGIAVIQHGRERLHRRFVWDRLSGRVLLERRRGDAIRGDPDNDPVRIAAVLRALKDGG